MKRNTEKDCKRIRWSLPLTAATIVLGTISAEAAPHRIAITLSPPRFPVLLEVGFRESDGVSITRLAGGTETTPWVTPETAVALSRAAVIRDGGVQPLARAGRWKLLSAKLNPSLDGGSLASVEAQNGEVRYAHHFAVYPDSPVVQTWTELNFEGARPIQITAAPTLALGLSTPREDIRLIRNRSLSFAFEEVPLAPKHAVVFSAGPHSGQRDMDNPWFHIERQDSNEVLTGGVAWSGYWKIQFRRDDRGATELVAGADGAPSDVPLRLVHTLPPGERFTTPKVFFAVTRGGLDGAGNTIRPWLTKYVLPETPQWAEGVIYNSWYTFRWDFSEKEAAEVIARAAELGVSTFVFDAGWYRGVGDWRSHPEKFPNGIEKSIADIHARGMRAGLWVCFQLVAPDHPILKEHPDWVVEPRFTIPFMRDAVLLRLDRDDVQNWILEQLDTVASYGPDWIKYDQDFFPPKLNGSHYAHVRGFYAILDEFKRRHPDVLLETCMSGGQISDVAALSRSHSLWLSDGGDWSFEKAEGNRRQIRDASVFYPTHYLQRWTCHPEKLGWDEELIRRAFRSCFGGAWGLCADLRAWTPEMMNLTEQEIGHYNRLNEMKRNAFSYRSGVADPGWEALAFVRPDAEEAAALLYRVGSATPKTRIRIPGLQTEGLYRITAQQSGFSTELSGATLAAGLEVPMENARSEILWIQASSKPATPQSATSLRIRP